NKSINRVNQNQERTAVHKKPIFVQQTSLECQSVHIFVVFVQQSTAGGSAVHKKPVFVQETNSECQSVHKFVVFVQQSTDEDSACTKSPFLCSKMLPGARPGRHLPESEEKQHRSIRRNSRIGRETVGKRLSSMHLPG
ncbi:MAG: hypothetical protein MJY60_04635, partial [Bacteroidales bacterium]|nr:hypothetical protein [Bacteroidales bacterium]